MSLCPTTTQNSETRDPNGTLRHFQGSPIKVSKTSSSTNSPGPRAPSTTKIAGVQAPTPPPSQVGTPVPSFQGSRRELPTLSPWTQGSTFHQVLPGTRCRVLGWLDPGWGWDSRVGADPGTGGLFLGLRLRLQRRGAEDGAGQSPGNRLDDVTLTGGRRVPPRRRSYGCLEHLGICSPEWAGRSRGHFLSESDAIRLTVSQS